MSCEEYLEIPANRSKYLFQFSQKHIVDASKEIWHEHPHNRWLARLINHQSSKEANVKAMLVNIAQNKNVLVMVAKTEVAAFQEIRFDYGDEEARRMFDPWIYLLFEVNRVLKNFSIKWLFDPYIPYYFDCSLNIGVFGINVRKNFKVCQLIGFKR